jgi:4-methyl-5(b-hydroxyethyl)-thiazole monophosphate biosynthesis
MMNGAEISKEGVTVSGNITTGQGLGAAIPFALELISQLVDHDTANKISDSISFRG